MPCEICDDTRWILLDDEHEFVYAPCSKCSWLLRALAPIPAPVDALAFLSDSKRITLGEDEAWRRYDQNERRG